MLNFGNALVRDFVLETSVKKNGYFFLLTHLMREDMKMSFAEVVYFNFERADVCTNKAVYLLFVDREEV